MSTNTDEVKFEHTGTRLFLKSHINEEFMQQIDADKVNYIIFNYEYKDWVDGKKYPNENDLKILNNYFKKHKNSCFFGISGDESWQIPLLPEVENFRLNVWNAEAIELLKSNVVRKLEITHPPESKKTDFAGLLHFKDTIEELSFAGDYKNMETTIGQLENLRALHFSSVKFKTLSFLENLKKLDDFSYYGSRIEDWSDLSKVISIKKLFIKTNTNLENIDFVSHLVNIEELELWYVSKLVRFPNCEHLKQLKKVLAYDCNRLSDIEELKKLKNVYIQANGKMMPNLFYHTN
jgi:hypothetical protein